MSSSRGLRSLYREQTPEYDLNKLSKASKKVMKKKTSPTTTFALYSTTNNMSQTKPTQATTTKDINMEEASQSQEMIDMNEGLTKIAIAPEKIPGATPAEKLQYVKKKMTKIPSYKYTRYENHTGEEILVALFGKYDKAKQACTTSFVEGGNTFFRKVQATDTKEALSRTIRIWDIPTDLTKKDIATALANYGPIDQITIQQANSCLSSTVTLHNMDDY
ncbi:11432_t:CDS:2 [Acaulospora morrowiae]|uniref:11432_t:CDS:1 n=1 Tax=Acaulospora morrowiae TaxID=94023 RepID=A0A9N9AZ25_9GLOM|nr:11432_t:CDS:2 [Acaulospora morrowiae]